MIYNEGVKEYMGKKANKKNKEEEQKKQQRWLTQVFIMTFALSAIFNIISTELIERLNLVASFLVLAVVIAIGIGFDIIATSVTAASEVPFHAKAADKKKGAKDSVKLIKNAGRVSNVCADVIGDICGVLSGAIGALIATNLAAKMNLSDITVVTLIVTATITALTVFGKGVGKQIAIKNCNQIVEALGKLIATFHR